jgi:hypothetical protein
MRQSVASFSGPNAWGDHLTALEQATPVIEPIAVTVARRGLKEA